MPVTEAPRQVNVINAATVVLADTELGLADGDGFSCVVTRAGFFPKPNLTEVLATGCMPKSQTAAESSWEFQIDWLQDWQSPSGGLSGYALANDAQKRWVSVEPTNPMLPKFTGQVTVLAGPAYTDPYGAVQVAAAVWPVDGVPAYTPPVATAATIAAAAAHTHE